MSGFLLLLDREAYFADQGSHEFRVQACDIAPVASVYTVLLQDHWEVGCCVHGDLIVHESEVVGVIETYAVAGAEDVPRSMDFAGLHGEVHERSALTCLAQRPVTGTVRSPTVLYDAELDPGSLLKKINGDLRRVIGLRHQVEGCEHQTREDEGKDLGLHEALQNCSSPFV